MSVKTIKDIEYGVAVSLRRNDHIVILTVGSFYDNVEPLRGKKEIILEYPHIPLLAGNYDPRTNTLTWNSGEEAVVVFRKLNVGTVSSPSVKLYKGSSDVTSTYTSRSASVSNDGTTMVFTTPKFLNSLPPNTYKLHLKGTVDSLAKDLHTLTLVVLKRGN